MREHEWVRTIAKVVGKNGKYHIAAREGYLGCDTVFYTACGRRIPGGHAWDAGVAAEGTVAVNCKTCIRAQGTQRRIGPAFRGVAGPGIGVL